MKKQKKEEKYIGKIVVGIIAGIISGMFSAGGGMIVVPSLIHIFKLEETKARATSVFAMLPMVIASGFFYYNNNYIDWSLGIKCAIGGIVRRNYWVKTTKKIIKQNIKNNVYFFLNIYII